MAIALHVLGGVLIALGGAWMLITLVIDVVTGHYVGLVTILVASAYIMLAGVLVAAVGGIISRLDKIVVNTRRRASLAPLGWGQQARPPAERDAPEPDRGRPRREPQIR